MLVEALISAGHARAILGISDKDMQYEFAQRVFDEKMSVRDVEKEIKRLQKAKAEKPVKQIDPQLQVVYHDLEEKLKGLLGTKVSIRPKDSQKGRIEIEYYTQDDLDALVAKMAN